MTDEADTERALQRIATRIRADLASRAGTRADAGGDADAAAPQRDASSPAAGEPPHARLAHELRTPLAAIAAMAEILRDERFGPLGASRYQDYARSIHDSARHLLAVVEAMLDAGAGSDAAAGLTFVDLDVADLVAATAASMQPLAVAAGVQLSCRLAEPMPRVVADRRCVRQILLNLLSNALRHTPPGGRIDIAAAATGQGGLSIEVADSGAGMDAATLARVRAGLATSGQSAAGGSGFGLPLVHALARANGAEIAIQSSPAGTLVAIVFAGERVVPV